MARNRARYDGACIGKLGSWARRYGPGVARVQGRRSRVKTRPDTCRSPGLSGPAGARQSQKLIIQDLTLIYTFYLNSRLLTYELARDDGSQRDFKLIFLSDFNDENDLRIRRQVGASASGS